MLVNLDSPVELLDYKLYRSKSTKKIYVTFLFNNLSDKVIDSVKVRVYSFNQFDETLHGDNDFIECTNTYQEGLEPTECKGSGEKIYLSDLKDTQNIKVVVEKVLFKDGTIWNSDSSKIEEVQVYPVTDEELLNFLQETEGPDAVYFSTCGETRWTCICGRVNKDIEATCRRCGRKKSLVLEEYSSEEKIKHRLQDFKKKKIEKLEAKKAKRQIIMKRILASLSVLTVIAILIFGAMTNFTFSVNKVQLLKNKNENLITSIKEENSDDVEFLLKKNADPNFVNSKGENAITEAMKLGQSSLIDKLLSKDAQQINLGKDDDTVAHFAVKTEELNYLKQLYEVGIDMNAVNNQEETVLFSAIQAGNLEMIDYFIHEIEVDLYEIDGEGNNVMQVALAKQAEKDDLLSYLLELDLDYEKENQYGENTYVTAILSENTEIVKEFESKGLDIHNVDGAENNALHILLAAGSDNQDFLVQFIDQGVKVNSFNEDDYTPLFYAIINDSPESMRNLINHGADIFNVTKGGDTAEKIAEEHAKKDSGIVVNEYLDEAKKSKQAEIESLVNPSDDIVINYTITNDGFVRMEEDITQLTLTVDQQVILNGTYEGDAYDRVLIDGSLLGSDNQGDFIHAIQRGEGFIHIIPNYGEWDKAKETKVIVN